MNKRFAILATTGWILFLGSCKDIQSKSHGPIVLGDSSTIVTENDAARLQDLVADLQPVIPSAEEKKDSTPATDNTAKTEKADTPKKAIVAPPQPKPQPALTGNGIRADFEQTSVLIANVNGKIAGRSDLKRANGAVYTVSSGELNGNLIKVTGNVTKVSQRYQTIVVVKNNMGTLAVEGLSTTTDWAPLKGANNAYRISGLDARSLEEPDGNRNTIRNAVMKAAKRHHFSRRKVEEWGESVHNARSTSQKPCYVTLRSVMWKIDGKDDRGRVFSKQIRVDIPL
jgi:hypothetical protein